MLDKKTVLVVGSSKGIGVEIANSLLSEKFNVIAVSRTKPDLKCDFFELDINNKKLHHELKNYINMKYGGLDGLVLVAGIASPPFKNNQFSKLQSPDEFNAIMQTNLFSIYSLVYELEDILLLNCSIVFISSIGAHMAFPYNTAYQASKSGLEAVSRSLAYELSIKNIRSNSIALGYFKTDMTRMSYDNEVLKNQRSNRTLLGRWGEPKEVVGAVNFLLSDKSSYITGSTITIDGGWLSKGL